MTVMTNEKDRPQNDDLPNGWVWAFVNEIAEVVTGTTPA